jgi:predicted transcriptional regulator
MKIVSKKTIAAMIAGTFIIAGAASPFIVQAADTQETSSSYHQKQEKRQINPEEAAKRISDTFGIDQATILKYHNDGMKFRDISKAAFLAKAGNKSINDVISQKTPTNTWKDVAAALGITKEQMKATHQDIAATHLNKKTGISKKTALDLLHQGYHPRDIGMASELSKNTKKPIKDILSLKKINNTWSDVAKELGINTETFKQDLKEIGHGPHHRGPHHDNTEQSL